MLERADKIITFRCVDRLPEKYKSKTEDWDFGRKRGVGEKQIERTLDDVRGMRESVYKLVEDLVKRIRKE